MFKFKYISGVIQNEIKLWTAAKFNNLHQSLQILIERDYTLKIKKMKITQLELILAHSPRITAPSHLDITRLNV